MTKYVNCKLWRIGCLCQIKISNQIFWAYCSKATFAYLTLSTNVRVNNFRNSNIYTLPRVSDSIYHQIFYLKNKKSLRQAYLKVFHTCGHHQRNNSKNQKRNLSSFRDIFKIRKQFQITIFMLKTIQNKTFTPFRTFNWAYWYGRHLWIINLRSVLLNRWMSNYLVGRYMVYALHTHSNIYYLINSNLFWAR